MLINFTVKNHLSLRNEYFLSTFADIFDGESRDTVPWRDFRLVRSSYIFGNYEDTKHDFLDALCYMKRMVIQYPIVEKYNPRNPVLNATPSDNTKDSEYSISITKNPTYVIEYRFIVDPELNIKNEQLWLITPKGVVTIYDRHYDKITFNKRMFPEIVEKSKDIKPDQLLTNFCLSKKILMPNHSCIRDILTFFSESLEIYPDYNIPAERLMRFLKNPEVRRWVKTSLENTNSDLSAKFDTYCMSWEAYDVGIEDYKRWYQKDIDYTLRLLSLVSYIEMSNSDHVLVIGNLGDNIDDRSTKEVAQVFTSYMLNSNSQLIATSRHAGCIMNLNFIYNDQLYSIDDYRMVCLCEYKSLTKSNRYSAYLNGRI